MRYILLGLAMLAAQVTAGSNFYGPYVANYIRTVDGDTVEVVLHTYPGMTIRTKIRERTIDTPELRSPHKCERILAAEARTVTQQLLEQANSILVTDVSTGSFGGRMVGTIIVDGQRIGEILLNNRMAVRYEDRGVLPWCTDA